jgi:hypothetical protein
MLDGFVIPARLSVGANELAAGIHSIVCLIVYDGASLHLDTRTVNASNEPSQVQRHSFTLAEIGSIEFRRRLVGGHVVVRPVTLAALDPLPGVSTGEIRLKTRWADRRQAEALVSRVRMDLSESRM